MASSASSVLSYFASLSLSRHSASSTTPRAYSTLRSKPTGLPNRRRPLLVTPTRVPTTRPLASSGKGIDTTFSDNVNSDEEIPFDEDASDELLDKYESPPDNLLSNNETEEDIARAFEEMYGPAYSAESYLGNDIYAWDPEPTNAIEEKEERKFYDGLQQRTVDKKMVQKVVKGGTLENIRVVVAVGDMAGHVGVGVGKAKEVEDATEKAAINARRNIIEVPLTKDKTFPHRSEGKYGAAKVMLKPASPGSGLSAGKTVRIVMELAGVQNAYGKQLRSYNPLNNARATIVAMQQMMLFSEVAENRGIPMEELWK